MTKDKLIEFLTPFTEDIEIELEDVDTGDRFSIMKVNYVWEINRDDVGKVILKFDRREP